MKARIFFWSITSALAGFLFGFGKVVISGAEQTRFKNADKCARLNPA